MAAPVILGSLCSSLAIAGKSFTVTLPPWNVGDLAAVCVATRTNALNVPTTPIGWTYLTGDSQDSTTEHIVYRVMEAGDLDPVFANEQNTQWAGVAFIVDAGTFDPVSPIDVHVPDLGWNTGLTNTSIAASVVTTMADALAIATQANERGQDVVLLTAGWTDLIANCKSTQGTTGVGVTVSYKNMPVPGATGSVSWSIPAVRDWVAGQFAVKPSPAAAGVTVDVPLHTAPLTAHVPAIETQTVVNVPEHTAMITAFPPLVAIGTRIVAPLNQANVNAFAPTIQTGSGGITVPLHVATITAHLPDIRTGHQVDVPIFNAGITAYPPVVGVGTLVRVPTATLNVAVRVPTIGTGARVDVPLVVLAVTERAPTVSATPGAFINVPLHQATVNPYAPIIDTVIPELLASIESDADRLSFMVDQPSTLSYAGQTFTVISSEVDGEELDTGRTLDGWIEVQMLTSEAVVIPEHAAVRLDGKVLIVNKIDDLGGGMSVLYLS